MAVQVAIACDHAGYAFKLELAQRLQTLGYSIQDFGVHSADSCDYPDMAQAVGRALQSGQVARGLLICGSGIGMAMAANAMKGIRAVNASDPYQAKMARRHNDANVLTLGARLLGVDLAAEIAKTFLQENFEGGRHQRRVEKLEELKSKTTGATAE